MTNETAYERLTAALRAHNCKVVENGQKASAQCPAHEDRGPSLSITGINGQALVYCHAGCDTRDVLASLELTMADLFDEKKGATYVYDSGRVVHRTPDKKFYQTGDRTRVELFHLRQLREATDGGVYLCEGEKDVLAIESLDGVATTAPMGARNFAQVDVTPLAGRYVTAIVDRDENGDKWAATVAEKLNGVAERVRFVRAKTGKDAADHVAAGHGLGDFELYQPAVSDETPEPEPDPMAVAVRAELHQLRVRRDAKRLLDAEDRPPARLPEVLTLRERLARPQPPVTWRVDGWQPTDSRIVLAAQFKAGKTTMSGNLARCLVDGDLWLGRHKVEPIRGTLGLLDFEMSQRQLDQWLRDQRIVNDDRIVVFPMRGAAAAFDITDPAVRARWTGLLRDRGVTYLVWDCLRPVLDALGLDEQREAGRLLTAFDALLNEARVPEALLVHHMGHNGERSRGDSRIRDWPDVEWRLMRQDDEPSSPRFVAAFGRDVDVAESQLAYDGVTRRLTLTGGSRKDAAGRAALPDVMRLLVDLPGLSGRAIEDKVMEVTDHSQRAVRDAVKAGRRDGWIRVESGPRRSILHYPKRECVSASQCVASASTHSCECVSASIENALHSHTQPASSALPLFDEDAA